MSQIGGRDRVFEVSVVPGSFGFMFVFGGEGEAVGLSFDQQANPKTVYYWSIADLSKEAEYCVDLPVGFDIGSDAHVLAVAEMIKNRRMGPVEI